jgi:hypothetical protein
MFLTSSNTAMDSPYFEDVRGYLGNNYAVPKTKDSINFSLNPPSTSPLSQHLVKSQACNVYLHLCCLLLAKQAWILPVLGMLMDIRVI